MSEMEKHLRSDGYYDVIAILEEEGFVSPDPDAFALFWGIHIPYGQFPIAEKAQRHNDDLKKALKLERKGDLK